MSEITIGSQIVGKITHCSSPLDEGSIFSQFSFFFSFFFLGRFAFSKLSLGLNYGVRHVAELTSRVEEDGSAAWRRTTLRVDIIVALAGAPKARPRAHLRISATKRGPSIPADALALVLGGIAFIAANSSGWAWNRTARADRAVRAKLAQLARRAAGDVLIIAGRDSVACRGACQAEAA